jgi:GTP-binding protein HflX
MDLVKERSKVEKAVLVGLSSPVLGEEDSSGWESLDELGELLKTAGGEPVAKILQNRDTPDPGTFIGEGKVSEVAAHKQFHEADMVIFDNDLSPSQMRNLSEALDCPVLDRSALILDIFAQRAKTSEGRLQVELAQYQYVLTKLTGLGKSMSRLGGGIGTRGPGETKLETDRRHIRRRIDQLELAFNDIRRVRGVQREQREKNAIPSIAIVGYTNAGKSTLLGKLTGALIEANDRLFDTLDPTTRRMQLDDDLAVVFTDTVGFIRKLPHKLIEAFKATLEELRYADLILMVLDVSSPEWEAHEKVVMQLITELGVAETPRIRVFNKADKTPVLPLARENDVIISAINGAGFDKLLEMIKKQLIKTEKRITLTIPYDSAAILDMLYNEAKVKSVEYLAEGISIEAICSETAFGRIVKNAPGVEIVEHEH